MLLRVIAVLGMCLALAGCILQSKEPLFAETEGELLLAGYGSRFAAWSREDGAWRDDEETVTFVPAGRHYAASEGKDRFDVIFVRLAPALFAMQAAEPGEPTSYLIAEARPGELLVHALECKALRQSGKFDAFIAFAGNDCLVRDGIDARAMFVAIAAQLGEATAKLVPLP
jgi:hypothetical protein